jgi:hypothetical protein
MADPRPPHFTSGAKIGRHHTVEGLVRLAEGRMFYLLSDDRPDQPRRRCWSCQSEESPRSAKVCHACGAPMTTQRFLMSSRWDTSRFAGFEQLAAMRVEHPGLALPIEVLRHDDQLLAIYPYRGEGLMLDEASPLSNQRVLHVGQRVVGVLAALAQRGRRGPEAHPTAHERTGDIAGGHGHRVQHAHVRPAAGCWMLQSGGGDLGPRRVLGVLGRCDLRRCASRAEVSALYDD